MQQGVLVQTTRRAKRVTSCRASNLAGQTVNFTFPARVCQALRRRKRIPPSIWAERHRLVGPNSSRPGPWRNETTPYLAGIMDAWGLPYVREVVLRAVPQSGKTETILNCMAAAFDQDPGPMLLVMDVQDTSREMSTQRIVPMLSSSRRLKKYLTGRDDDLSASMIRLAHMPLYFAWATSVSKLANKAIKHLFLSEVDKYPAQNKREAGPVSLARKRVRTYRHTYKLLMESSPSTPDGEISIAFDEAEARFHYHVRCPLCGHEQVMRFCHPDGSYGVVWPDDERDPVRVQSLNLAHYICAACEGLWDDHLRDRAVRAGCWREEETGTEMALYCKRRRPRTVGFHYDALVSSFVAISEVAAAFLRADRARKSGDLEPLKDFMNGYLAEPWREDFAQRDEDIVKALRDDRPFGIVPGGGSVLCLLATADTQDDGFWYEIRAWAPGMDRESWQVRCGFVESLAALERVCLVDVYMDPEGNRYEVAMILIDSGGHRTTEVYDWCREHLGWAIPLRGEQTMPQDYAWKPVDMIPGTNTPRKNGLRRLRVNATRWKNYMYRKLQIGPDDPGAWHMAKDMPDSWAKQLVAESRDDRGYWQCPKGRPNHGWDVSYYQLVAADLVGTQFALCEGQTDENDLPQSDAAQPGETGAAAVGGMPTWFARG